MAKAHTLTDSFNDNALDPQKWMVVIPSGSRTR
jgi:hypothetical protein